MAIVLDGTNGINTPDLESAGPISGTTGTFSGAVQASGVATNLYPLVSATAVASTSGTSIDFTGIPSWVRRVTVMFSGVSTNGNSNLLVQIGSGSIASTGYDASAFSSNSANANSTAGFILTGGNVVVASSYSGSANLTLANPASNLWVSTAVLGQSTVPAANGSGNMSGGNRALSGVLDRVRITTVNGTDTFDAGSINIMYEG